MRGNPLMASTASSAPPASAVLQTDSPLRDFSDRLSPMIVKELRQGLRLPLFIVMHIARQSHRRSPSHPRPCRRASTLKCGSGKAIHAGPGPSTPSGFSRLSSGPAPKPSFEMVKLSTRSLVIGLFPSLAVFWQARSESPSASDQATASEAPMTRQMPYERLPASVLLNKAAQRRS